MRPVSGRTKATLGDSIAVIVHEAPLTKPRGLSKFLDRRNRKPGRSKILLVEIEGSPGNPPRIAGRIGGRRHRKAHRLTFCTPLCVTVSHVKRLPRRAPSASVHRTALPRGLTSIRPRKNSTIERFAGCSVRASLRNDFKTSSLVR